MNGMNRIDYIINNTEVTAYSCENTEYLLIQAVDEHDMEILDNQVDMIVKSVGEVFTLAAFKTKDWNGELSPWEAPPVFGKQGFGGGAGRTLDFVEKRLIPDSYSRLGISLDVPVIVGGYSLAALFSLWSSYQSDRFAAVAAASPSVWFPGWQEYITENAPKCGHIYLSLGDKEDRAKNKVMARVGECIRSQYETLKGNDGIDTILEWNEGNHFRESDVRTAKGFVWCIERLGNI